MEGRCFGVEERMEGKGSGGALITLLFPLMQKRTQKTGQIPPQSGMDRFHMQTKSISVTTHGCHMAETRAEAGGENDLL